MSDEIWLVAKEFKTADVDYIPGDRFDLDNYLARDLWTERTADTHKRMKFIVPLTRQTYQRVMVQRPVDAQIGRGFTEAFLVAKGIIDQPVAKENTPAPKTKEKKPKPAPLTSIEITAEAEAYGDYFIVPKARPGHLPPLFYVADQNGALLRPQAFQKTEKAKAFLDALPKG